MDKIVIVASFAFAAILLVVDITYDVVSYYRRKKLLQELLAAELKSGDILDDEVSEYEDETHNYEREMQELEEEILELQHSEEEDEEDACLTCKHCEECEPLDKAHAFDNGCVRWE